MSVMQERLSEEEKQRIWEAARELLRNKDAFSLEEGVREAMKAHRALKEEDAASS